MGTKFDKTIAATGVLLLIAGPLAEASGACELPGATVCRPPSMLPTHGNDEGAPGKPDWQPPIPVRGTNTSTFTGSPDPEPWAVVSQEPEYGGAYQAGYVPLEIISGNPGRQRLGLARFR